MVRATLAAGNCLISKEKEDEDGSGLWNALCYGNQP
jgi:hypothetical protein